MKTRLIAFAGTAGCGKTTLAEFFVREHGFVRVSFATPLRAMIHALGLTPEDLSSRKEIPHPLLGGKTPRFALQTLGTEWGRNTIDQNLWVRAAMSKAHDFIAAGAGVVIDDCRFDDEADAVRAAGGVVVHVMRSGTKKMDHASERGVSHRTDDIYFANNCEDPAFAGRWVMSLVGLNEFPG